MSLERLADLQDVDRGRVSRGGRRLCLHWYREVGVLGVWAYFECRCGRRRATRIYRNLMGPLDWPWLEGADRLPGEREPLVAPPKPGGLPRAG